MKWWGRRRAVRREAAAPARADDPYAAYLRWVQEGRPALEPADLLGTAIALPAASAVDDVAEDAPIVRR